MTENKQNRSTRTKSKYKGYKLQKLLESTHKGFAYQLLQLQMALQDQTLYLNRSKLDDISKLIQLYMQGVQALQCFNDHRYKYFSKKLQALMLKKTVFQQLHSGTDPQKYSEYMMTPHDKEEKKREHEMQLLYTTEQSQKQKEKELVEAERVLTGCEVIVKKGIKEQENSIKERIRQRRMRSENSSAKNAGKEPAEEKSAMQAKINEYFGGQQQRIIGQGPSKRINFVTVNKHDI